MQDKQRNNLPLLDSIINGTQEARVEAKPSMQRLTANYSHKKLLSLDFIFIALLIQQKSAPSIGQ